MANELARKGVATILQFPTYESSDASIEREEIIECTDVDDGIVELSFDMRRDRQRTYVRTNREDLMRMIRIEGGDT